MPDAPHDVDDAALDAFARTWRVGSRVRPMDEAAWVAAAGRSDATLAALARTQTRAEEAVLAMLASLKAPETPR